MLVANRLGRGCVGFQLHPHHSSAPSELDELSSFFGTARPSHTDLHRAQGWAHQGDPPRGAEKGNCLENLPQAQLL